MSEAVSAELKKK